MLSLIPPPASLQARIDRNRRRVGRIHGPTDVRRRRLSGGRHRGAERPIGRELRACR